MDHYFRGTGNLFGTIWGYLTPSIHKDMPLERVYLKDEDFGNISLDVKVSNIKS